MVHKEEPATSPPATRGQSIPPPPEAPQHPLLPVADVSQGWVKPELRENTMGAAQGIDQVSFTSAEVLSPSAPSPKADCPESHVHPHATGALELVQAGGGQGEGRSREPSLSEADGSRPAASDWEHSENMQGATMEGPVLELEEGGSIMEEGGSIMEEGGSPMEEGEGSEDGGPMSSQQQRAKDMKRVRRNVLLPEDGFKWFKYGEKELVHSQKLRAYFRCSQWRKDKCDARKFADFAEEERMSGRIQVSYVNEHNHPKEDSQGDALLMALKLRLPVPTLHQSGSSSQASAGARQRTGVGARLGPGQGAATTDDSNLPQPIHFTDTDISQGVGGALASLSPQGPESGAPAILAGTTGPESSASILDPAPGVTGELSLSELVLVLQGVQQLSQISGQLTQQQLQGVMQSVPQLALSAAQPTRNSARNATQDSEPGTQCAAQPLEAPGQQQQTVQRPLSDHASSVGLNSSAQVQAAPSSRTSQQPHHTSSAPARATALDPLPTPASEGRAELGTGSWPMQTQDLENCISLLLHVLTDGQGSGPQGMPVRLAAQARQESETLVHGAQVLPEPSIIPGTAGLPGATSKGASAIPNPFQISSGAMPGISNRELGRGSVDLDEFLLGISESTQLLEDVGAAFPPPPRFEQQHSGTTVRGPESQSPRGIPECGFRESWEARVSSSAQQRSWDAKLCGTSSKRSVPEERKARGVVSGSGSGSPSTLLQEACAVRQHARQETSSQSAPHEHAAKKLRPLGRSISMQLEDLDGQPESSRFIDPLSFLGGEDTLRTSHLLQDIEAPEEPE